ncbi:MAG: hypothetical protein ACAI38_20315 [Myxococcota bacterium]|nr:hypothetical protein [Myxococcota bacterium]
MRIKTSSSIFVVAAVLLTSACAGKVNKGALAEVRRLGVLSVTIDNVGEQPSDIEVLRAAVDAGNAKFLDEQGKVTRFELVRPDSYQGQANFAAFRQLDTSPTVRTVLEKMAADGQLKPADASSAMAMMKAKMSGDTEAEKRIAMESVDGAMRQFATIIADKNKAVVGASNMPVVPYAVLKPDGSAKKVSYKGGNNQEQSPEERLRDVLLKSTGQLAADLGLDGFAIVHWRSTIRPMVGVGVWVGDRGLDSIWAEPTMIIINKNGEVALDMGYPSLDSMAPKRSSVPVYKKTGEMKGVVDLADPKGKVLEEYQGLLTLTAETLVRDEAAELAKN